jgi:hypothetical protein
MLEEKFGDRKSEWISSASDGTSMLASSLDHLDAKARESLKPSLEFVIHSLRHTYHTRLGAGKVDVFTIMKLAGYSDIKIPHAMFTQQQN